MRFSIRESENYNYVHWGKKMTKFKTFHAESEYTCNNVLKIYVYIICLDIWNSRKEPYGDFSMNITRAPMDNWLRTFTSTNPFSHDQLWV
jgi:hypothetical protein